MDSFLLIKLCIFLNFFGFPHQTNITVITGVIWETKRDKFIKHLTSNLLASRPWCREIAQGLRAPAALAKDRGFSVLTQWLTSIGNYSSKGISCCFLTSVGLRQAHVAHANMWVNISTHKLKKNKPVKIT